MARTVLHRAPLFHWKMKIGLQNDSKMTFFPSTFQMNLMKGTRLNLPSIIASSGGIGMKGLLEKSSTTGPALVGQTMMMMIYL